MRVVEVERNSTIRMAKENAIGDWYLCINLLMHKRSEGGLNFGV